MHTQGKWVLLRGGIEIQSETNYHEIFAYVGEHPIAIASVLPSIHSEHDMPVSTYHMDENEGMANANLIASASDLLESLQFCSEVLINIAQTASIEHRTEIYKYAKMGIDTARTAITKARGET